MLLPQGGASGRSGWAAWPPVLVTWGPGGATEMHAHHAMHVMLAREGTLGVETEDGRPFRAAGVATAPDTPHAIDARGRETVLVFVDPESVVGSRLRVVLEGTRRVHRIDSASRDALAADLATGGAPADTLAGAARALARLGAESPPPRQIHPRVRRLLAHLAAGEADTDVSLAALARVAGLSESRLVHAFTESIGISLKAFILWRKVQRATRTLAAGSSLAVVAHDAGFSDAAHMTRTFKRTFGVSPSELRRVVRASATRAT